jgi:uncharacterized protein YjiS (DUF1127 family)
MPAAYRKAIRDAVYEGLCGQESVARKVADMTRYAWIRYWTRRAERAAVAVLHTLDDRTLRDIGLDRREIEPMVRGAQARERRVCWTPAGHCGLPGCC